MRTASEHEVRAHRVPPVGVIALGSGRRGRGELGMRNRSARGVRPERCRLAGERAGIASPTAGPTRPPAMIPTAGLVDQADHDADRGPGDRRHELAPARDQADREADHRRREDDVDARTASGPGSGRRASTPASVARFHGMNVDDDRADPVAPLVGPPEPPEVRDRQGERLVGQEMGHQARRRIGHVPEPRRERGGVEQVPGVEQDAVSRTMPGHASPLAT